MDSLHIVCQEVTGESRSFSNRLVTSADIICNSGSSVEVAIESDYSKSLPAVLFSLSLMALELITESVDC